MYFDFLFFRLALFSQISITTAHLKRALNKHIAEAQRQRGPTLCWEFYKMYREIRVDHKCVKKPMICLLLKHALYQKYDKNEEFRYKVQWKCVLVNEKFVIPE